MKLTKEFKSLLLMNASSTVIFNYIGIFVNLYIWEKNHSIFDVAWFNLILFATWAFGFIHGTKLLTKRSIRFSMRLWTLCAGATFLLLQFLHLDSRALWIAVVGAPVGMMWGYYASAQNLSLSLFGKGKDFENFFSWTSIAGQAVNVANPVICALVIKSFGYPGSFALMLAFVAALFYISFRIPPVTLAGSEGKLFENAGFSKTFSTPSLRWLAPSCLAAGVLLQFQGLFALIFTFSVTEDKMAIALLNVLYAASSVAAMAIYKKAKIKAGAWLAGGMAAIAAGFLAALFQTAPALVASNLLTTVGMFYFGTVWNTRQFGAISKLPTMHRARLFIWRECFLLASRVGTLALILPLKSFKGWGFGLLMALALACAALIPYFSAKSEEAGKIRE